ncbi:MAG: hypothetical protein ACJZ56_03495 [Candidatus Thalassarchaeaceae archaeon]
MEDGTSPSSDVEEDEKEALVEEAEIEPRELMDVHALPIRAKPLFHNNEEDIEEFPLCEAKDGLSSTSIVVGDGVFRVVTTTLHKDGVPRVDVKLVMDAELTSFQHVIEKPTPVELGISAGFGIAGLILMMIQGLTPIILGLSMFLIGLKFLPTKLETHRLMFSSCGNSHEIKLTTMGSFIPGFKASMALVGPAMADYIKIGQLDASGINELHAQLHAPAPPQPQIQPVQQLPLSTEAGMVENIQQPVEIMNGAEDATTTPEQEPVVEQSTVQKAPQPSGPPTISTVAPKPVVTPLPPAPAAPIGPPTIIPPPPVITPPTPAVVPPAPSPLPPPLAPMPAPPTGLNQPIPLDMPMPEAPRIAVQATPNEEPVISQEEQDALLNELA